MTDAAPSRNLFIRIVSERAAIHASIPELQHLAATYGQPGTMHGLDLLLGSRFSRRKRPVLVCFYHPASNALAAPALFGAVLLMEYRLGGFGTALFATADAFGVRTVVGPAAAQGWLCVLAGQQLMGQGARLVLTTFRHRASLADSTSESALSKKDHMLYATSSRVVQDTLPLHTSSEATLQTLGKRTRVHMRAARRKFDREYPEASLQDATGELAQANDDFLRELNQSSLDMIDQDEFNHQVRSLCRASGGFVLGLSLGGRWIALIGGWRQGTATWIEWQCNGRGFEKLSLGSVVRTYLFEEEARRGTQSLSFHGGTSHSMLHRFEQATVNDLLIRRESALMSALLGMLRWIGARRPHWQQRGNFLWNALCAPEVRWFRNPADAFAYPAEPVEPEQSATGSSSTLRC